MDELSFSEPEHSYKFVLKITNKSIPSMPASVHCTDVQFFTRCRPRCTVRTYNSSHVAGLGALYGRTILHTLPASVHCTGVNAFKSSTV